MLFTRFATIFGLVCALAACGKREHAKKHVIELFDTSASIVPEAASQAITASEELIPRLERGDTVTIIPILGDAGLSQGSIIRFQIPEKREAYDNDLHRTAVALRKRLEEFRASVLAKPSSKTDIIGALGVASQEFAGDAADVSKVLVLLSDLIQDDPRADFARSPALQTQTGARDLAERIGEESPGNLATVHSYIGLLRSADYKKLNKERRRGIETFWKTLFAKYGTSPRFAADGPSLMHELVNNR